ncbi:MAG: class I SAM-dependent methyltransferase [Planctomycetota bacterium]|jgi:ubiquinone/menaquinone biosynthesis C-methylase UbiE|nr:class I SAM-dependent methyltransferase [Planctomycetota bacterium]
MLKSRWTMLWMLKRLPKTLGTQSFFAFGSLAMLGMLFVTSRPCESLAQDGSVKTTEEPKPLTKYLGRRIAIPMSYHGIPWLNRPERIQEENPEEMLEQLEVQAGMTVCDMGCGDGYYTMELAKRVGPTGKVIAVDIQPEMLQELSRRCERNNLKNVDMVLGLPHDPKLPPGKVDLILMVDVYHEFSNPVEMLTAMRESLKPNGRIALVEFRGEDPQVPIKPEHKMTKKQILKEYEANKMGLVKEYDRLPWQHLMFLGTGPQEKSPKQPKPE